MYALAMLAGLVLFPRAERRELANWSFTAEASGAGPIIAAHTQWPRHDRPMGPVVTAEFRSRKQPR